MTDGFYHIPSNVDKNCGIYRIKNMRNGKCYIGSSKNLPLRKKQHFTKLEKDIHPNVHLQRAWNLSDDKNIFEFQVFIYCREDDLIKIEQNCFYHMKPDYNISAVAGGGKVWDVHPMLGKTGSDSPAFGKEGSFKGKKHSFDSRLKMGRSGEKHNQVKLTEHQVLEIRASTESCRVLAKRFGVTSTSISNIKNRKVWKHVG